MKQLLRSAFDELYRLEEESDKDYGLYRCIVGQTNEYLKSNYTINISLQDVAEHVAISKNFLIFSGMIHALLWILFAYALSPANILLLWAISGGTFSLLYRCLAEYVNIMSSKS